jgi:hypothetical protein
MKDRCMPDAHGPGFACDRMGLSTDGQGFPHRGELQGRRALRHCEECARLVCRQGEMTPGGAPVGLWTTVKVGKEDVPVRLLCPACHGKLEACPDSPKEPTSKSDSRAVRSSRAPSTPPEPTRSRPAKSTRAPRKPSPGDRG